MFDGKFCVSFRVGFWRCFSYLLAGVYEKVKCLKSLLFPLSFYVLAKRDIFSLRYFSNLNNICVYTYMGRSWWLHSVAPLPAVWLGVLVCGGQQYGKRQWLVGCWSFTSWQHLVPYQIPTSDSAHSWWLHSAAPLGDQATNTMTWYHTQPQYSDTEPTSPIVVMAIAWLDRKWQVSLVKLLVWLDQVSNPWVWMLWFPQTGDGHSTHSAIPYGAQRQWRCLHKDSKVWHWH